MWQLVTCFSSPSILSVADKDINHACWTSSGDKKDLSHQMKVQNRGKEICLPEQSQSACIWKPWSTEVRVQTKETVNVEYQRIYQSIWPDESRYKMMKSSWCYLPQYKWHYWLVCLTIYDLGGNKALSDKCGLILQRCVKLPVRAACWQEITEWRSWTLTGHRQIQHLR